MYHRGHAGRQAEREMEEENGYVQEEESSPLRPGSCFCLIRGGGSLVSGGDRHLEGLQNLVIEIELDLLLVAADADVLAEPLLEILREVGGAGPAQDLLGGSRLGVEVLHISGTINYSSLFIIKEKQYALNHSPFIHHNHH